ncbi:MAG: glycosyltransferase family 39 protein [Planctomycetota bacterium]
MRNYGSKDFAPSSVTPLLSVVVPVGIVSAAISAFCFSATQLWLSPEARGYIVLAGGIAERFDFSHDLFLLRTPGYPILLAGLFKTFGSSTPEVLRVLQFTMVVATALIIAAITWHLTHRRTVAVLTGILCASNVQLLGFANMVMSEIPYTLALTLSIYYLIRFLQTGQGLVLALSSLFVGVSYLFRPIGLAGLAICLLACLIRIRRESSPFRFRRMASFTFQASLPAMTLIAPWFVYLHHRGGDTSAALGPALYRRTVTLDRLDTKSPHLVEDVRITIDEAKRLGTIRPDADPLDGGSALEAFTLLGRKSYPQTCARLRQIGVDLIQEHAGLFAWRSLLYAAWTVCEPDSSWRFLPGGAKGIEISGREWRRSSDALFWDCATYEPMMRRLIEPFLEYFPLSSEPRSTTPAWSLILSKIHRFFESPVPIMHRNAYECFVLLCLFGFLTSIFTLRRPEWFLVGCVILLHIVGSSILVGPVPRYAVPIQPLLPLGAALAVTALFRVFARVSLRRGSPTTPAPAYL